MTFTDFLMLPYRYYDDNLEDAEENESSSSDVPPIISKKRRMTELYYIYFLGFLSGISLTLMLGSLVAFLTSHTSFVEPLFYGGYGSLMASNVLLNIYYFFFSNPYVANVIEALIKRIDDLKKAIQDLPATSRQCPRHQTQLSASECTNPSKQVQTSESLLGTAPPLGNPEEHSHKHQKGLHRRKKETPSTSRPIHKRRVSFIVHGIPLPTPSQEFDPSILQNFENTKV